MFLIGRVIFPAATTATPAKTAKTKMPPVKIRFRTSPGRRLKFLTGDDPHQFPVIRRNLLDNG